MQVPLSKTDPNGQSFRSYNPPNDQKFRAQRQALESRQRLAKKAGRAPRLLSEAEIREVFRRFHAANPEPKGELEHINPYTLLVAVVLSAQATDAGVNKATRALFKIADSPKKMLALG